MNQKIYQEWQVSFNRKGEMAKDKLTERETVSISERTAEVNNSQTRSTKLYYELVEQKSSLDDKTVKELNAYIDECGYEIDRDVKKADLIAAIIEVESNL